METQDQDTDFVDTLEGAQLEIIEKVSSSNVS